MSLRIAIRLGMKGGAEASARGDVVIVVDVLRASSTIVAALASGMRAVVPVQATTAAGVPPEWITAGERDGRRIPGFQHGNSPLDLASRDYRDRTLYLTTTNGTAVIGSARGAAGPILVGALLNATAVAATAARLARDEGRDITLLTAGHRGRPAVEDTVAATAIGRRCPGGRFEGPLPPRPTNDLHGALLRSPAGRRLVDLGHRADVEFCARVDLFTGVPVDSFGELVLTETVSGRL